MTKRPLEFGVFDVLAQEFVDLKPGMIGRFHAGRIALPAFEETGCRVLEFEQTMRDLPLGQGTREMGERLSLRVCEGGCAVDDEHIRAPVP